VEQSSSWETNSNHLLWNQKPSKACYWSSSHLIPISLKYILIFSSHLHLDLPTSPFLPGFPTTILYAFLIIPMRLHTHPISSYFSIILLLLRSFRNIRLRLRPRVTFRNMLCFLKWKVVTITSAWRTTFCRLSVAVYLIDSQLPDISGGNLMHPQSEGASLRGGKRPISWHGKRFSSVWTQEFNLQNIVFQDANKLLDNIVSNRQTCDSILTVTRSSWGMAVLVYVPHDFTRFRRFLRQDL
jgi:hypothetical protein